MKEMIVLKGLPGSGKSTWARQLIDKNPGKYKRINKDSLREMLDNSNWSKANEKFVESVRDALITEALDSGYHVIVDDTNFEPGDQERIRELSKGKANVQVQTFDIDLDECIKRDLQRPTSVGETVIRKMYNQYLRPVPDSHIHDPELPDAIIVDLDGTLAIIGDRSPYDATNCHLDTANTEIRRYMDMWWDKGNRSIILMSGRQEKDCQPTLQWLRDHDISFSELYMRATGDTRNDAIVKRELFEKNVAGKFNIEVVIDDRKRVVEMWRSLGLQCWQVAEGDF